VALSNIVAAAAAACRAEEEAAEQRRLQAAANIAARRQQKAAMLPEEPAAGTAGIATIRLRLPDGKNCQRRFGPDTTVQVRTSSQWSVVYNGVPAVVL
jgi:hypothetical protein